MYARMLMVELGSVDRDMAESLAQRWHAAVSTLPGFVSVSFVSDDAAGEYGYFSVWESLEEAKAVEDAVGPQLPEAIREIAAGPPRVRYFEVYEPRT